MNIRLFFFISIIWTTCIISQDHPLITHPDVSENHIVFVSVNDIWIVDKTGGVARKLTSAPDMEQYPKFSSNGQTIAYSAMYEGNVDIYTLSVNGGEPRRLTTHPEADLMVDWYPGDEHLLFASKMKSERPRFNKLFKMKVTGGQPEQLPLAYAERASLSPDANQIAFTLIPDHYEGAWKRYKGGRAPDIWVMDLNSFAAKNISNHENVDSFPMWHNKSIYFISERGKNHRANLWKYDTQSELTEQMTFFEDFDVMYPSCGSNNIVFEAGGKLFLMDLTTNTYQPVEIQLSSDYPKSMAKQIRVDSLISSVSISPDGAQALIEARGELFTMAGQDKPVYNHTQSSGVAERFPAWSPDGQTLACFCDRSGEYNLCLKTVDAAFDKWKSITNLGPGFRFTPFWSPDCRSIAFVDNTMTIFVLDIQTQKIKKIDKDMWLDFNALCQLRINWSADSRYLTYSRGMQNRNNAIFIYDTHENSLHQITSGYYNDTEPIFCPEGDYLFFTSSRTFSPLNSDQQETWIYANSKNIAVIPLTDGTPSPLSPGATVLESSAAKSRSIDFENCEKRIVLLPVNAGNYSTLRTLPNGVLLLKHPRTGSDQKETALIRYDLGIQKETTLLNDVDYFELSLNKEKMVVKTHDRYHIVKLNETPTPESCLNTKLLTMHLDPKAEWLQMFKEVWRYERDFFYDQSLHQLNWEAIFKRYEPQVQQAHSRSEINTIFRHLIGELGAGHVFAAGGDLEQTERRKTGLLGADFVVEKGFFKIKRILDPGPRACEIRSPLVEPGLGIKNGDYIVAVNNTPFNTRTDICFAFENMAEQVVCLTINSLPQHSGGRNVFVKTLSSETRLRELDWVEQNRQYVLKKSEGKLGYIYVPDTSNIGQSDLMRQFRAQYHMQGLVIDERFNSGGALGARLVELLNRPLLCYISFRNGEPFHLPDIAHPGPMALLINGWCVSGGDGFPFLFQTAKVGPVIGMRTTGAFVGPNQIMPLVDGGVISAPPSRVYDLSGRWQVENHGVEPDIMVIDHPGKMAKGEDPQLDRAIIEVLNMLKNHPPRKPKNPFTTH